MLAPAPLPACAHPGARPRSVDGQDHPCVHSGIDVYRFATLLTYLIHLCRFVLTANSGQWIQPTRRACPIEQGVAMTTLLTTHDVAKIVATHGLPDMFARMVDYLEADFAR